MHFLSLINLQLMSKITKHLMETSLQKIELTDDKIVLEVMNDLNKRSLIGKTKYNTTLEKSNLNLRDFLQHAYEECLDQANYLKAAITKIDQENISEKETEYSK